MSTRKQQDRPTCGKCKHCYDEDPWELDGLCRLQKGQTDNVNYVLLDSPACEKYERKEDNEKTVS